MDRKGRPDLLALRHAVGKAKNAVVPRHARFVLGADTVVWCKGKLLGKPKSTKGAIAMLSELSGRDHHVYTGVAILDRSRRKMVKSVAKTRVRIKRLTKKAIQSYFKRVSPYDKAGAYAIQIGPRIVEQIDGSYTNVMGLPSELVRRMLKRIKWRNGT